MTFVTVYAENPRQRKMELIEDRLPGYLSSGKYNKTMNCVNDPQLMP